MPGFLSFVMLAMGNVPALMLQPYRRTNKLYRMTLLGGGFFATMVVLLLTGGGTAEAAITYQTPGAVAYSASGGSSVAPAYPASVAKGDLLVLIIGMKPSLANSGSVTTPTNWTAITSLTGAGGYGATLGADTGNTNVWAYYRVADGTESGSLTVTISTNNVAWAKIFRMSNATGGWSVAGTTGSDTSAGSVSITMSADPGVTSGDYILGGMVIPTDVTTPAQFSAEALTQTGVTFGTVTEVQEPDSTTGNDIGGFLIQAPISSGTSSAAPVMTATAGGTTTNVRGPGIFIRAREVAATTLADGTNPGNATIAPDGSITAVDVFTLTTSSGTDAITAVTVNLSTNSGVGTLTITDGSDVSLGSIGGGTGSGISTGNNVISISSTNATTGGATFKIKVTPLSHANMPAVPGGSYSITATVADWTGTNAKVPYTPTGDTSSTVTIDNASPNAATSTSGSAGSAAITLGWTTASGETTDSVVLRWAASSPGSDVPVEGSSYSAGNTIGTATVACVFTSQTTATVLSGKIDGTNGSSGCNTSALTNDQAYSYKIFQKDSNGNYDAGTTVTGGPFTPAASTIAGSCKQVDRTTNCADGQTVKWAINGTLQGTTTTTSSGTFTISPGTFPVTNDIITVFIDNVVDANEAVAVTKYDGTGSISGVLLYAQHLTIGSADNQSLTNANLESYDNSVSADEDIFFDVTTNNLVMDATTSNSGQSLYVVASNTYAPGGTTTVAGSWINAGTFTHGSSTVTLNGTSSGYIVNANGSSGPFYNLTINGSGGGWTVTSTDQTIANTLTITAGTLNLGSRTTTFSASGSSQLSVSGTMNVDTSTISFTGTSATTIPARTYYNLSFAPASGSPTYTMSTGTTTINNDFTVGGGAVMTVDANPASITLDVNGSFTIASNAVFNAPGSGKTFSIAGSWLSNGTFNHNSGTVLFDATSTGKTIAFNGGDRFYTLQFNGSGGGWSASTSLTVSGGLTMSAGTLSGSGGMYIYGGGFTGNGTINLSGGTVTYNETGSIGGNTNWTFSSLVLGDGGSTTITANGSGSITVSGTLTNTSPNIFNAGSKNWILSGTGSPFSNGGTFNAQTSTFTFTGGGSTTIPNLAFQNLESIPSANSVTHTFAAGTYTIGGNFTAGGTNTSDTVTAATNATILNISGNVSIASGTTFIANSSNGIAVGGSWTNSGTFTHNNQTITFNGSASGKTITCGGSSLYSVVVNNASGGWTLQDSCTIANTLTLTAGTLNGGSGTLTLSGTTGTPLTFGTGSFSAGTGTVAYTGNNAGGNTTVGQTTYYGLTLNNASETYVLAGTTTLSDTLTITAGTLDVVAGQNYSLNVGGSWSNSGTFTPQNGTVTMTATSTGKTINNGSSSFYNLTLNGSGGGWSPSSNAILVQNDLTVSAGTLSGSLNITVNGGDITGNGTIQMSGGTVLLDGSSGSGFGGDTAWSFYNLTFGDGSGTATTTSSGSGSVTVQNTLTVAANQTLDAGSKTWILSGTGTPLVSTGTFTPNASTISFTGNGATTIPGSSNGASSFVYYNLSLLPSGSATYTLGSATLQSITVNGDLVIGNDTNTATIDWDTYDPDLTVKGNITLYEPSVFTKSSSATLTLSPSGTKTVTDYNSSKQDLGIVSISGGSSTPVIQLGSSLTAETINIAASHALDINGTNTLTLTGNGSSVLVANGTFTASSGTTAFVSASTTGTTIPALTYYNLTVNKTGNTFTAANSTLVVQNNFSVSAGTFIAPSSAAFSVGGNFANAGTFTHNSGTITFSGSQAATITGTTAFNSVVATTPGKTLAFEAGATFTITGTATITGAAGQPINLVSTSGGAQWIFYLAGSASISYANVKDSACHASSGTVPASATINNGGNNGACWGFIVYGLAGGATNSGGSGSTGSNNQSGGGSGAVCGTASGTVTVSGGVVTGVVVANGGGCYTAVPAATICGGGGSGATITAVLTNGVVTSVTVNAGGSGYGSPTVVFGNSPDGLGGGCPQGGGGQGGGGGGGGTP